jgi:thiopurine S-methyltransferase
LLGEVISGTKLFCVFGSGLFVQGIVDMLLSMGVWAGNIRTDYTTKIDAASLRRRQEERTTLQADVTFPVRQFAAPRLNGKGRRCSYLTRTNAAVVMEHITEALVQSQPVNPVEFMQTMLTELSVSTPTVVNTHASETSFWNNYWETNSLTWQSPEVSPWLKRVVKEFVFPGCRVFVPLCGKSADLKYLLDIGCHVIGAECSAIACEDFFLENNIDGYMKETVCTDGDKSTSTIVRHFSSIHAIELYEGDIFHLTDKYLNGKVNVIIDRAALVALTPDLIAPKYLPLMCHLLEPVRGVMYLASVSELPDEVAPPHKYTSAQIENLVGTFFDKCEHKEDYRYRVHSGYVCEPIYKLHGQKTEVALESYRYSMERAVSDNEKSIQV